MNTGLNGTMVTLSMPSGSTIPVWAGHGFLKEITYSGLFVRIFSGGAQENYSIISGKGHKYDNWKFSGKKNFAVIFEKSLYYLCVGKIVGTSKPFWGDIV